VTDEMIKFWQVEQLAAQAQKTRAERDLTEAHIRKTEAEEKIAQAHVERIKAETESVLIANRKAEDELKWALKTRGE